MPSLDSELILIYCTYGKPKPAGNIAYTRFIATYLKSLILAKTDYKITYNRLSFRYKWLDKKYVGTSTKIVIKKVLMDQFLMTPPLYVIFYTSKKF